MTKTWKKIVSLTLAMLMTVSMFAACGGQTASQNNTDAGEPTQPGEEGKILKVLTLGHSLSVDCGHMLALIANTEGYESMKVGTLYYSGCPLNKHVQFLNNNSAEYSLYISSTDKPNSPPTITNDVTMEYALKLDYWDVIVMQGGVFEIALDKTYKSGLIQIIQKYVNETALNPYVEFMWHMPWAPPLDNTLRDTYPYPENNTYYSSYLAYDDNRATLYNAITKCVTDNIVPDKTFTDVIPTGTAMENALSSYLEETDLHRDYAHATDLARVMNAYLWFCKLTGVEQLTEIKLDAIPMAFFKSTMGNEDRVLTDAEKAIILESVNNALKTPFAMTQSQYTTAP